MTISASYIDLSGNYSDSWSTPGSGELKIYISPDPTFFTEGKTYKFAISLEADAFASNQSNFNSVYVQLRLLTLKGIIYTNLNGLNQINIIGVIYKSTLNLVMPDKAKLNLSNNQLSTSELEYKVDYKTGLGNDTSYSTDWVAMSTPYIELPASSNLNNVVVEYIGFFVASIGGIFLFMYLVLRKSKSLIQIRELSHSNSPVYNDSIQSKNSFCPNCGQNMSLSDSYCSDCGQYLD